VSSSGTNVNQVEPTLIKWNQVESTLQNIQHSTFNIENATPSTMQLFGVFACWSTEHCTSGMFGMGL